jgi:hypothetical protein
MTVETKNLTVQVEKILEKLLCSFVYMQTKMKHFVLTRQLFQSFAVKMPVLFAVYSLLLSN